MNTDAPPLHYAMFGIGVVLGSALGLVLGSLLTLWLGTDTMRAMQRRIHRWLNHNERPNLNLFMQ